MWQTPKGTRDFLPEETEKRNEIYSKIRSVFKRYGYGEVTTPAFEDFELLAKKSGKEIKEEIYYFKDKGGRALGLRFDPTVPICRIVATNPSIPKPIKLSYITNMWRYDQPGAGRWREFWQAGVEVIGSPKPEADAEILALTSDILKEIGVKNFYIKVSSRKVIEKLAKEAEIPDSKKADAFRAIDKLQKIGESGVLKEFKRYRIPEKAAKKLLKLIKTSKNTGELADIIRYAKKMGVKKIDIDLSIVRGIDYYTGFVFETFVKGYEKLGSVCSGGRYDTLIKIYGGQDLPATGFGMGIDRLMEILGEKKDYSYAKVYVAAVKEDVRKNVLDIVKELRKKGVSTDFDLVGRNLRKQLDYANSKNIPYVLIVGPKEVKEKKYTLRNMKTGKEEKKKLADLFGL
jgi:histidyl-tRNA synthetase